MSRGTELIKNTGILALGTLLPKAATFVTLPVLTGCLTTEEYGAYDLAIVVVSFLLPVVTMQLQSAAFRFLIDVREDEKSKRRIISSMLAFVVPISVIATLVLYFVLGGIESESKYLVCAYFFLEVLFNSLGQCVRGLGMNSAFSAGSIVYSLVQLILAVVLVLQFNLGLFGALVALCLADFLSTVYFACRARIFSYVRLGAVSPETVKAGLKYSVPMMFNSISSWMMRLSNRVVLTLLMGITANAVFAAAYKIPQMLILAQSTFAMAWQENASVTAGDSDSCAYYSDMFRTVTRLMTGFTAVLMAFSPFLFAVLIRGDYQDAYPQIPLLIIAMTFNGLAGFLGGIYVAFMDTKSVGKTTIVAALINVVLCVGAVPLLGLYGASLAMLVSYVYLFGARVVDIRRRFFKLDLDTRFYVVSLAVLLAQLGLCYLGGPIALCANLVIGTLMMVVPNKGLISSIAGRGIGKIRKRSK